MLILNTESCPTVSISQDRLFVKLKSRNPISGRLIDTAGFHLTPNEALQFYQELFHSTIKVIDVSKKTAQTGAMIMPFDR